MRNKYLIVGSIVALVLMVGLIVVLTLFAPAAAPEEGEGPLFGESGSRDIPLSPDDPGASGMGTTTLAVGATAGKFRLLAAGPVSGSTILERQEDGVLVPVVRYTDRTTGHIYDMKLASDEKASVVALTTTPRVRESFFLLQGSTTVLRYTDEGASFINTYLATITPSATGTTLAEGQAYELEGSFLSQDIRTVAVSPQGNALFYLEQAAGGSRGFVRTFGTTGGTKLVWQSPLRELHAQWTSADTITLTTSPSAQVPGYLFELRPSTISVRTILANKKALTALGNPSGTHILYADNDEGFLIARVLNRKTGAVVNLPFTTLPEKCVWSARTQALLYCAVPEGIPNRDTFPDVWYQGQVSLNDTLWLYDVPTESAELLDSPEKELGGRVDIHALTLDPSETYLLFRTRIGDALWSYTLPERQPTATSTPSIPS